MLAAHTRHVALGTHHPSWQLTPGLYCQGKAGAESGTCVWKFLSWTVSDKLSELHVTLCIAEAMEEGSENLASIKSLLGEAQFTSFFLASLFSPIK